MNIKKEHNQASLLFNYSFVLKFDHENVGRAVDALAAYDTKDACAIIDKMSPLGATLILCVFHMRARKGNVAAQRIVSRAEKLKIRGVAGEGLLRKEIHELTGAYLF